MNIYEFSSTMKENNQQYTKIQTGSLLCESLNNKIISGDISTIVILCVLKILNIKKMHLNKENELRSANQ